MNSINWIHLKHIFEGLLRVCLCAYIIFSSVNTFYCCIPVHFFFLSRYLFVHFPSYRSKHSIFYRVKITVQNMNVTRLVSLLCAAMETIGAAYRVQTGIMFQAFFAAGYMLLAGLASLIRDYAHLQLTISLIPVVFLSLYW